MLIGPGGTAMTYVEPSPPPRPPTRKQVADLQSKVAKDQSQYKTDLATLQTAQTALTNLNNAKAVAVRSAGAYKQLLKQQIKSAQDEVNADKQQLHTDQATLKAAQEVQTRADNYKPTAPPVTVKDPVTKAVNPVLTQAKGQQSSAQTAVNSDKTALDATQTQINQLSQQDALHTYTLTHLANLQKRQGQQQAQLKTDQHSLDAANAKVAAAHVVGYSQQAQADQKVVQSDFKTLRAQGVVNSNGTLNTGKQLTADQKLAYDRYVADANRLNADNAAVNQNSAQLQVYASERGTYGGIADDASKTVDHALAPLGLTLVAPKKVSSQTAQANLEQADQAALAADAPWNAATALVKYDEAQQKLTALTAQNPANPNPLLPGAQLAVARTGAAYEQADSYAQQLYDQAAAQTDQQAVQHAQTAYNSNPTTKNQTTLTNAQLQLEQDQQLVGIDKATFVAATAEVYADSQPHPEAVAQMQVASIQQQITNLNLCLAPNAPLEKQLGQAQAALASAAAQPADVVADNLSSYANLLQKNDTVWLASLRVPSDPTQSTAAPGTVSLTSYDIPTSGNTTSATQDPKQALAQAKVAQSVAQYQFDYSNFRMNLPANLLDPKSATAANAAATQWNDYATQHHVKLSDAQVANQLAQLAPAQKVDVSAGITELQQYEQGEQQILNNRSLLEEAWDGVSGKHSDTQTYLQKQLDALQTLESKKNQMSAADYNARYLSIMGNASSQYGVLSAQQVHNSQNWNTAEQIVVEAASAAAAIAVTVGTAGTGVAIMAGATAGFATSQAMEGAQNVATVAQGGDLNSNTEISLFAPLTNNFFHGGVTSQEWGHAGVDAGIDAVSAVTTAAGVEGGAAARVALTPAVTTALKLVPEGATMAQMTEALSANSARALSAKFLLGGAGMTAAQAVMSGGQMITTTGNVMYAVSQGQMTAAQADQAISSAGNRALFNLATAPVIGGIGAWAPTGFRAQTVTNLATNATLIYGWDGVSGQGVTANDTLSVLVNTMSMTGMNSRLAGTTGEQEGPASTSPEPKSLSAAYNPQRPQSQSLSPETQAMLQAALDEFNQTRGRVIPSPGPAAFTVRVSSAASGSGGTPSSVAGSGSSGDPSSVAGSGSGGGTGPGSSPPTGSAFVPYYSGTNPPVDVAIVGGGNVGHTLNADLVLNSSLNPMLLFRGDGSSRDRISPAIGTATFHETLHESTHNVELGPQHFGYMATPAGTEALQQAKIVVVTMPDAPQSRLELFQNLQEAGLVEDPEKTFVLIRAGQAGQPALSQIIRNNPNWNASVVLVEDSPYGTRYAQTDSGPAITGKRKDSVEISVLGQGGDEVRGLTAMRDMFPLGAEISKPSWPDFTVVPGIEMPWRFGYAIHPRVAFDLQNLQITMRGEQYLHYVEGVHPELGRTLGQLDQERVDLAAAYGVRSETFPQKLERQFGLEYRPGESFYETMQRTRPIYLSKSYGSVSALLNSRYPQEDVPGLFTMNWFARKAGLDLPGHAEYESYVRDRMSELGMPDEEVHGKLEGYLPLLERIEGGIPEVTQLLNTPHLRPEEA